jgi:hypothetical protein
MELINSLDQVKLGEGLENPESFANHSVVGNDERDGSKNCKDWAISRQWSLGIGKDQGSTTRSVSPNNNPIHERPARSNYGDDIVCSNAKALEDRIKSLSITQGMEQIEGMTIANSYALTRGQRV